MSEEKWQKKAKRFLKAQVKELSDVQKRLYANDRYSVLIIFQGRDAVDKDGTIKHVVSGINPQGCQAYSFKAPLKEEIDHGYIWRCYKALLERGADRDF